MHGQQIHHMRTRQTCHTVQTSVVRLDVCLLHRTVLNDQSIALRAVAAKDGGAIEGEV